MGGSATKGLPVIGAVFLALGVWEFITGDDWVVWILLGFLFGGFGIFASRKQSDKGP